jgi:hypothetical protein
VVGFPNVVRVRSSNSTSSAGVSGSVGSGVAVGADEEGRPAVADGVDVGFVTATLTLGVDVSEAVHAERDTSVSATDTATTRRRLIGTTPLPGGKTSAGTDLAGPSVAYSVVVPLTI